MELDSQDCKEAAMKREAERYNSIILITEYEQRVLIMQNSKLEQEVTKHTQDSRNFYQENQEFKIQLEFLRKRLELNSQLKNIDIEELKMLAKSNSVVNETISSLIHKWQDIQTEKPF